MNIPGTWQQVSIGALLSLVALGSIACAVEKPLRRYVAARRMRSLRRQALPAPDGAVVPNRTYYIPHWSAAVGRAYRASINS